MDDCDLPSWAGLERLTSKERECLRLCAEHMPSKAIARALNISPHTVDHRLDSARRKIGAATRREAARRLVLFERSLGQVNDSPGEALTLPVTLLPPASFDWAGGFRHGPNHEDRRPERTLRDASAALVDGGDDSRGLRGDKSATPYDSQGRTDRTPPAREQHDRTKRHAHHRDYHRLRRRAGGSIWLPRGGWHELSPHHRLLMIAVAAITTTLLAGAALLAAHEFAFAIQRTAEGWQSQSRPR
ncbi:helix-turn-helix domain-containing protein [Caulobacter sp. NIBR2454]|uniref:helix-turn-helix domain-containing protein n=1 Tax=Caulobacter sp. NIBR2454 TaxID=3015996 RepID=UPI0022B744CE|nr:helix-turn-helix transcriptional regulator [Caulobacter sp. NIBR2454]